MTANIANAFFRSLWFTGYFVLQSLCGAPGLQAQSAPPAHFASVELRVVHDSTGCPEALDMWLLQTTDTIQGFEALIAWDRPGRATFIRPLPSDSEAAALHLFGDSGAEMSRPSAEHRIACEFGRGLLSDWSYHEARSSSGYSVKITAISGLMSSDPSQKTVLGPHSNGLLCRLPFALQATPKAGADSDSVVVRLVREQVRMSNTSGRLLDSLIVRDVALDFSRCTGDL